MHTRYPCTKLGLVACSLTWGTVVVEVVVTKEFALLHIIDKLERDCVEFLIFLLKHPAVECAECAHVILFIPRHNKRWWCPKK